MRFRRGFLKSFARRGHESVHVRDYGMQAEDDATILNRAEQEQRIIVSADTDFGGLLAERMSQFPSFILFRGNLTRIPSKQLQVLLANLSSIEIALSSGAIVVFEPYRIRIRNLPLV